MDHNYLCSLSMLPSGRYYPYGKRFERRRGKVALNFFCIVINFFCALKCICIMVLPASTKSILYLGELYLYETPLTQIFQLGCSLIHLNIGVVYVYWSYLCRDASKTECLSFLFIPNLAELCEHYDLDLKEGKKYLRSTMYIRYFVYSIMFFFEIFFIVFFGRCLMLAYLEIEFKYFLLFTVPLSLLTWFSYQCLIFAILIMHIFLYTTQAFLQLRVWSVGQKIREFPQLKRSVRGQSSRKIKCTINDIVRQFNATNILFDDLL